MKITKKSIVLLIGALFALIGFFMMFVGPLGAEGTSEVASWKDVYFGIKMEGFTVAKGAAGAVVGFFFLLIGAFALIALALLGDRLGKISTIVALGTALLLLVGAILVFCTKQLWLSANDIPGSEGSYMKLAAGPIVGGIFGLIATAATGVGTFLIKD